MKQQHAISLVTAILLAGAGGAYAGAADSTGTGYQVLAQARQGNIQTPSAGGAVKNPPGAHDSLSNVDLAPIGQWAVGQTLYDREGDAVGTVKGVHQNGNALIVSISQAGGIGANDIVLEKQYLNQSGSGSDMRLITNLNKAQLGTQPTVGTYGGMR